jgi:hypothetical protein
VWDRQALADPGGTQPLALKKRLEHFAIVEPGQLGGMPAQVLQHLLLAAAPQGGHDSFRTQEIKQRHGFQPFVSPARRAGQPWDLDNQVPSLGSAIRTGTADTVSQFLQASGQGILSAPRSRPTGGSIR